MKKRTSKRLVVYHCARLWHVTKRERVDPHFHLRMNMHVKRYSQLNEDLFENSCICSAFYPARYDLREEFQESMIHDMELTGLSHHGGLVCVPSLVRLSLSSPLNIVSGIKKQPMRHMPIIGTSMVNTACIPFIFASRMSDSQASEPDSPICQLPSITCSRTVEGSFIGRADFMTANWTAVDSATPTTEPNARIMLRVEVATARSSDLERACSATRAL